MTAGKSLERTLRAAQRRRAAAAAVLWLSVAWPAQAAALEEQVVRVPVAAGLEQAYIDVTVFRGKGAGPFPILVLSHGSPRSPEERRSEGRQRLIAQSEVFVGMGFAVLVPTRRGYGDSRAPWAGGFGSVAASATIFEGLVAVINFAGRRGSQAPDQVCVEARLVEAMARYGGAARVPELWIYSANDRYFSPALARRMHQAFVQSGGAAELVEAPATGLDGHGYFARAMDDWGPRVERFLVRVGAER